ncbi:MAG: hypothetical protein AB7P31_12515 [Steroidobacteraceae bacterium]
MQSREKDLGEIDKRGRVEQSSDAASSTVAAWIAFDAAYGSFADEYSTL